jgi:uncharacterized DUF497 family protein
MDFEWDETKAHKNKRKHLVSFEEGAKGVGFDLIFTQQIESAKSPNMVFQLKPVSLNQLG